MQTLSIPRPRTLVAATLLTFLAASQILAAPPWHKHNAHPGKGQAAKGKPTPPSKDYEVVEIQLPADAVGGGAFSINNSQTVGGIYTTFNGEDLTFLWSRGKLELFRHPGSEITAMPSITDSGNTLYGNWGSATVQHAGFYNRRTGKYTEFPDIPGKPMNYGQQMNNAGIGSGMACEGDWYNSFNCVPWLWDGSGYQFLSLPAGLDQFAYGINNRDQIVGGVFIAPPFEIAMYLWDRGKVTTLLPGTKGNAWGINDRGQVLAIIEVDPTELFRMVLIEKGSYTRLPQFPGSLQTAWWGLNERGDLAGYYWEDFSLPPKAIVAWRR